ncbi:MAG: efflux RND transporter periplasmic adaptor subunit [Kofleriaceae bacterium]
MNTHSQLLRRLSLSLLPLLLLGACTASVKPSEPDPTSAQIEAAPEEPEPLPTFQGVVTTKVNQVIISEVDARIEKLDIKSGTRVKAGELIAVLDDSRLKQELVAAKAQAAAAAGDAGAQAAQARAAAAKLRTERLLAKNGAAPRNAVREAQFGLDAARGGAGGAGGRYKAAYAQAELIQAQIDSTRVKAPIDGVISRIKVKPGGLAQRGTPIAQVFDTSDLRILFKVDRDHRHLVKAGDRIAFKIEGEQRPVLATIIDISSELEPPLNFVIVTADLDDTKLAPDQIKVASSGRVSLYDVEQAAKAPQQTAAR